MNTLSVAWRHISQYVVQSCQELKRVVWPTRAQTINHTIIVIIFSLGIALFLGTLDLFFGWGLKSILIK